MSLAPGSRIGPYEVTALLGAGGMGEVYRATDTNLGREVAIKVLPADVAGDSERLARFRREAQLLAALNHPNIASIYGIEERNGTPFLVLELVEGEDLSQRLARGPLQVNDALEIARFIAEALEEAHEKGIVHRDLKPANVKLSPDGKVKVLDFGLAKAFTASVASGPGADLSRSPTLVAQSGTRAGVILGTAAYMAPEQARGRPVDRRADIWAFGVVLWEMLTGRMLFSGETLSDIIAAVLTREPQWGELPAGTPPHVAGLLRRCLERDPRKRLQAIGEARLTLDGTGTSSGQAVAIAAAPVAASRRSPLLMPALIVLVAVLGAAAILALRPPPQAPEASARQIALSFDPPAGHTFIGGLELSRDGESLAFVARDPNGGTALWVRSLGALAPRRLPDTDGARFPFWSPDGRRLGFFASSEMKVVDLIGGALTSLARTTNTPDVRGASWGAGDVIVYARDFTSPLLQVPASGGTPAPATQLDKARHDGTHRWPSFLPDGKHFLFYASGGTGTEPGELRLGELGTMATRTLTSAQSRGVFLPPHRVLFVLGKGLMSQPLDLGAAALTGQPTDLGIELTGAMGVAGFRFLSAAQGGTLAYRQILGGTSEVDWVDRQGRLLATEADDGAWHFQPRLSPDGRRIAVAHYAGGLGGHGDIYVHDAERQLDTPITFDELDDEIVAWSPDGRMLAVTASEPAGGTDVFLVDPARPGARVLKYHSETTAVADDWFPDGGLVLSVNGEDGRVDIYRLPPEKDAALVPVVVGPFSEYSPALTPDGRWLAYVGDSTGRDEVYVRALGSGAEWRVSRDGGASPCWRADGRELFYVDPRGNIVAVPTSTGASFSMGPAVVLFAGQLEEAAGRQFDVTPDGQKFILNRLKETSQQPIVVLTGLPEEAGASRRQ